MNWPSPVFEWFQNGCNKVVIEPYVTQFWSEIILAHMWERGWGWLMLNLCERFWWNSYLGSKIVRFLRKTDGPSRNLDKDNFFSQKERRVVCRFWLFKYILWPPVVCPRAFTSSSLCMEACIFAKYYRSILILFSVNYGWGWLLLQN